jgi:CheY-like chemotaxis protein
MAPELFIGASATPVSDLYACGVLMFHALTGSFPVDGDEAWGSARNPKPIPATLDVSQPTRLLCERLLANDPADRPQRALDVLEIVESVLAAQVLTVTTDRPIALVADADEQMRTSARERLEVEGYHVEAAVSAQDALELAFSLTPAVVVLDSNVSGGREIVLALEATEAIVSEMLPQHGALAVCRVLQHDPQLQRVPILVMSKRQHPALTSAFRLMGAAEVIPKPFTQEEFASGLNRARRTVLARADER